MPIGVANIPAPQLAFLSSITTSLLGQVPDEDTLITFATELNTGTTRAALANQIYQSADAVAYRAAHQNALGLAKALNRAQIAQANVSVG